MRWWRCPRGSCGTITTTISKRELRQRRGLPATTEDYLTAVVGTRPTLTARAVQEFGEDIETYSRL